MKEMYQKLSNRRENWAGKKKKILIKKPEFVIEIKTHVESEINDCTVISGRTSAFILVKTDRIGHFEITKNRD